MSDVPTQITERREKIEDMELEKVDLVRRLCECEAREEHIRLSAEWMERERALTDSYLDLRAAEAELGLPGEDWISGDNPLAAAIARRDERLAAEALHSA